jgi:hypothetical protein
MKNLIITRVLLAGFLALPILYSCHKDYTSPPPMVSFPFKQTNLVVDAGSEGAANVDANLLNAWGIAVPKAGGPVWISAANTGLSTIYDTTGKTLRPPVTVPSVTPGKPGSPTGVVFNSTADFAASKFIFATADGSIAE